MKYVITGGAGYIGGHLARILVMTNNVVDVIDNLSSGNLSNLAEAKYGITLHRADIRNPEEFQDIFSGKDGIFHHAALTSVADSYTRKQEYHDVNVEGTRNVLEAAVKSGTKVVFASSAGVYGNADEIPTPETAKPRPANPYGATKAEAELLARKYQKDIDIVGLRYFNVYGEHPEGSSLGVISRFYKSVLEGKPPVIEGDGMQVRDFVSVNDVIRATVLAMQKDTGSQIINIGSGVATSILDLANMFIKYSGKDLSPVFAPEPEGNVRASQADISLAANLLGWKPQAKLAEWVESLFKP